MPKRKKMIIFESFLGKQYSDNPRAIYEYLKINNPEFILYWSIEGKSLSKFKHHEFKSVRRFSFKWMIIMNRSKYWITNSRLPLWIPKPKGTMYVQTWHGTPLKRLANDMHEVHMPGTNTIKYKKEFLKESRKWDYLISPNEYSTNIFKRAFKFNEKLIESGYPRNDYLVHNNNQSKIEELKKELVIPLNKKVILYAPTWRDNEFHERGNYKFDVRLDLEKLKNNLSDEYIIILRMHYLISESIDLSSFGDFVYNLSDYEDIRALYLISDMMITDYSSVLFDYAILKRPILFFVYDLENYRDKLRGFYFDFESSAPGPLVKTTDDLIFEIRKIEKEFDAEVKYNEFYKKYCSLEDGHSSKRVVNKILKIE